MDRKEPQYRIGLKERGGHLTWLSRDGDKYALTADGDAACLFSAPEMAQEALRAHLPNLSEADVVVQEVVVEMSITVNLPMLREFVISGKLDQEIAIKIVMTMKPEWVILDDRILDPDKPVTREDAAAILASGSFISPKDTYLTHHAAEKLANYLSKKNQRPVLFIVTPDDGGRWIVRDNFGRKDTCDRMTVKEMFSYIASWLDDAGTA